MKTLRAVLSIVLDRHHRVVTASSEIERDVFIDDLFVIGLHTDSSPCSAELNGSASILEPASLLRDWV